MFFFFFLLCIIYSVTECSNMSSFNLLNSTAKSLAEPVACNATAQHTAVLSVKNNSVSTHLHFENVGEVSVLTWCPHRSPVFVGWSTICVLVEHKPKKSTALEMKCIWFKELSFPNNDLLLNGYV